MSNKIASIIKGVEINPWWIVGLTAGEGSFVVHVGPDKDYKLGYRVHINYSISLTNHNVHLLWLIKEYFGVGGVGSGGRDMAKYQCGGFNDILTVIIPFFEQYPLLGNKAIDFNDFRTVALLMKDRAHLTKDGLEKITLIASGMNTGRDYSNINVLFVEPRTP